MCVVNRVIGSTKSASKKITWLATESSKLSFTTSVDNVAEPFTPCVTVNGAETTVSVESAKLVDVLAVVKLVPPCDSANCLFVRAPQTFASVMPLTYNFGVNVKLVVTQSGIKVTVDSSRVNTCCVPELLVNTAVIVLASLLSTIVNWPVETKVVILLS